MWDQRSEGKRPWGTIVILDVWEAVWQIWSPYANTFSYLLQITSKISHVHFRRTRRRNIFCSCTISAGVFLNESPVWFNQSVWAHFHTLHSQSVSLTCGKHCTALKASSILLLWQTSSLLVTFLARVCLLSGVSLLSISRMI